MKWTTIEVTNELDEVGEPEVFTWDLFPVVDASLTSHLDENGLPKRGTVLRAGMIAVGKIGKSHSFDPERQPTALEIEGLDFSELSRRYGRMWRDGSVYATESQAGVVRDAWIETGEPEKATVVIERS